MALKILLADDNMAAQNMGKKILAAVGYDVVTVSNGVAAIKKITEVHPDIVLLDVYMAGNSGVELCKKMKATAELAKIPVLLTVGKMEPFSAEQGIKVKADGLIVKPFDVANLITAVEKLTGHSRPPELAASPRAKAHEFQVSKEVVQPPFSRQQGGEVCDVCGHVNREAASACQQCDVPLPSSVIAPSSDPEAPHT